MVERRTGNRELFHRFCRQFFDCQGHVPLAGFEQGAMASTMSVREVSANADGITLIAVVAGSSPAGTSREGS